MDIIIKSFNRPYLLDRCLTSIRAYLKGFNGTIHIIDDGTPEIYLQKLKEKFPEINIIKSEFYENKKAFITAKTATIEKKIPINDWVNVAKLTHDFFILLEDDMWFTSPIDLEELQLFLKTHHPLMVKLCWLNNNKLIEATQEEKQFSYIKYTPKIAVKSPFLLKIFLFNRFKIRKILSFLRFYSTQKKLSLYTIYSVAGVIFDKKYFLNLWNKHNNQVKEDLQLQNALSYCYKTKFSNFYRSNKEVVQTSFISSATNYPKGEAVPFDMFAFNNIINDLWLHNEIHFNSHFNSDLSIDAIAQQLLKKGYTQTYINQWKAWISGFKNQYKAIGCKI